MNEWMNKWMKEQRNEGTNERMNEWTNEWMNKWRDEQMNVMALIGFRSIQCEYILDVLVRWETNHLQVEVYKLIVPSIIFQKNSCINHLHHQIQIKSCWSSYKKSIVSLNFLIYCKMLAVLVNKGSILLHMIALLEAGG